MSRPATPQPTAPRKEHSQKPNGPADYPDPSIGEAFLVWLRIGLLSFGGPAGQIALMHRVTVEEKKWLDDAQFLHALNFCMMLPGPEAQQLATYIGWLLHRTLGGLIAGILFVLPGALVILGLSILYALHADMEIVAGLFYGLKAAVIAIVLHAVVKIGRKALTNKLAIAVAFSAFCAIFLFGVPFPLIIAAAAFLGFFSVKLFPDMFPAASAPPEKPACATRARPSLSKYLRPAGASLLLWILPVILLFTLAGPDSIFTQMATFFSKMAVVTFGGAYAVLAYVAQQAVETYGWMTTPEMVDGLGLAETTPGPLIMVVQFVGFLGAYRAETGFDPILAGILGAAITTWVTFAPCFFWIFLGAPFIERLRGARALSAALSTITAAVFGVVTNLALWFSIHVIFEDVTPYDKGPVRTIVPDWLSLDPAAAFLALFAIFLMVRLKVNMIAVLMISGTAGAMMTLW